MSKKDFRFIILEILQKRGTSTEEVQFSNDLFELGQKYAFNDLATVRRTLIELLDKDLINESNVNWKDENHRKANSVIENIKTDGATGEGNNRIERLKDRADIKEIRLYITLNGKRFLIESENLRRTTWMIKNDIKIKIGFMILGAALTLLIQYVSKTWNNTAENSSPRSVIIHSEPPDTIYVQKTIPPDSTRQ